MPLGMEVYLTREVNQFLDGHRLRELKLFALNQQLRSDPAKDPKRS